MKKILSGLILISFLAVLIIPQAVLAQGPVSCCELGRDIKLGDVTYKDTHLIGEKGCTSGTKTIGSDADDACPIEAGSETESNCYTPKWGMICFLNTLYGITDWVFVALIALAGIFVVLGAFNIVTSSGSPEKVTSGRNYVLYAAIGLAVAFLARAIPAIVRMIVGA